MDIKVSRSLYTGVYTTVQNDSLLEVTLGKVLVVFISEVEGSVRDRNP